MEPALSTHLQFDRISCNLIVTHLQFDRISCTLIVTAFHSIVSCIASKRTSEGTTFNWIVTFIPFDRKLHVIGSRVCGNLWLSVCGYCRKLARYFISLSHLCPVLGYLCWSSYPGPSRPTPSPRCCRVGFNMDNLQRELQRTSTVLRTALNILISNTAASNTAASNTTTLNTAALNTAASNAPSTSSSAAEDFR